MGPKPPKNQQKANTYEGSLDDGLDYGWEKAPSGNKKQQVSAATRTGDVATEQKWGAANHNLGPTNAKKLDEDTGSYKHKEIPSDFKKALMQARTNKKLTQAQLAQQCNLSPKVVQDYEAGKAVPDGQIISKLNRALGVTLPKIPKQKKVTD
jgi:putative transcription factor